jgi:arginine utilization protein RocB
MDDLLTLCAYPTISESESERSFSFVLANMLKKIPYFCENPKQVRVFPVSKSRREGYFVFALMKSKKKTAKTIMLLSHFDVVGTEEYGAFSSLAFSPREYMQFLKDNADFLSGAARADLLSGNFLFGRGVCDMKWGIAADLELFRYFDAHPDELDANILFVSVPDEENNSAGMRAAVRELGGYCEKQGLKIAHCVVSEPDIAPDDESGAHKLFVGAAGKLMPSFFCVGMPTHAGNPFSGLNPNLLTAALVMQMELDANYIDRQDGFCTPAPVCLKQEDLKEQYSVQTPGFAYAYFNAVTLNAEPSQMLEKMRKTALCAWDSVKRALVEKQNAAKCAATLEDNLEVITYAQLCGRCRAACADFDGHLRDFEEKAAKNMDLRRLCALKVREACRFYPGKHPLIVLFFCPPYYPHASDDPNGETVRACRELVRLAAKDGTALTIEPYFQGITDMCYLALRGEIDRDALKAQFPVWGGRYSLPLEEMKALGVPFVNFGPLGRDAHRYTERIDLRYSFARAPELLFLLFCLLAKGG